MKDIKIIIEDWLNCTAIDNLIINDLKKLYKMNNKQDKKIDYKLLESIQVVLQYYMPRDDWLKWKEENPIIIEYWY